MSNSGVNTAFPKCFILFMAVVILLQGSVYLGLSIWGIILRQCSNEALDVASKPFQFAMNLVYFLDKNCGNPSVQLPDLTESVTLDVEFSKADPIATRTFILFATYAVISLLWVIASLVIITTVCCPITRTVKRLCFWPWFLVVMAGSVLDAVSTGFFIHDIMNTSSVAETFNYLGISANDKTVEILSTFDAYFITPAVIMACLSSRVIVIWLLNIFGSCFCLSLSKTLSKMNSKDNNSQQDILPAQTQQYMGQTRDIEQSKPTVSPLTIQSFQEHPTSSAQLDGRFPKVPSSNLYFVTSPSQTDNVTKNHPDTVNHPLSQYQQQLSPITPLNNRYSTNSEIFQYPMQHQRFSDELRGQLPWSYTSFPTPVPKKTEMQVYPEIPAPDYGY